ncbi:hypothetical protein NGRA_2214 [Nosema granulosis]|uniref:Uncharacterized protein n=1 Tax=Nosema granulosis TaxID=83296 RepID=A0A9P6GXK5_9MICR|nr:hypothetical protein NGRA_2214 [Nosema granulosis]
MDQKPTESTDSKIPVLVEISNIMRSLLVRYGSQNIYMYTFCGIGAYLLFLGIMTRKISLSVILTILIAYYAESISNSIATANPEELGEGFFRKVHDICKKISEMIENNYVMMLACSFILSSILIALIGTIKYVLAFIAIYLFYNTYVSYFVGGDKLTQWLFFGATILLLFVVVVLFGKLFQWFLIILYSFTGTLIFLVTLQYIFQLDIGIVEMVEEMGNNFILEVFPNGALLFCVFCIGGATIQLLFIPSISFL